MMQYVEGRPTLDSGMCFICETSPDDGYIDTLYVFDPGGFTYLNGRKFVCHKCAEQMARLIGFAKSAALKKKVEELESSNNLLQSRAAMAVSLLNGSSE
jgi:hypothetical protein